MPSSLYSNILTDEHGEFLYCSVLKVYEKCEKSTGSDCNFTMEIEEVPLPLTTSRSLPEKSNASSSSLSPREPNSPQFFNFFEPGSILLPKGLVILSKQPMFNTFHKILLALYKISKRLLKLPMECYISHMILQIPLPSRGYVSLRYLLGHYTFNISLPPCNKLPVLDIQLGMLFSSLDLDNLLILFRNILLEKSTVFVSSDEQKLIYCTYGMLSLIFPFHWNMVYVPILPISLLDYLYSPVTFVFGVHSKYISEIYSRVSDSVCIVDLDNNSFLVSDMPTFHRKDSVNVPLPKLPDHYGKKLKKHLTTIITKVGFCKGKNIKLLTSELDEASVASIRNYFLRFFVSILKGYKKFMYFEGKEGSGQTFNGSGFISSCSDKEFMNQFIETQMFSNFCESRIRPKNVEEHCEGLYFDEEIQAKDNRSSRSGSKAQLPFLNDSTQDHHSTYIIPAIDTLFKSSKTYQYPSFPNFDIKVLSEYQLPAIKPPKYAENIVKSSKVLPN